MKKILLLIAICPVLAVLLAASGAQYTIPMHTGALTPFACGSLPFSDSFSGSGGLTPCWSITAESGSVACSQASGASVSSSASSTCVETVTGLAFPNPTQYVQGKVSFTSGAYSGICPSMKTTGYGVCYFPANKALYSITPTGGAVIQSGLPSVTSGNVLKVTMTSTSISIYDVTTSTTVLGSVAYSNTTYNSGPPGMWVAGPSGNSIAAFTAD